MNNYVKVEMATTPENVGLARIIVAGFLSALDATVEQVTDIKTAVSEAVTNAIIHGYSDEDVVLTIAFNDDIVTIEVIDKGVGIADVDAVREPMFTTMPDMERSGLGFTVMESFMDTVQVKSKPGAGTTITLTKKLGLLL